MKSKRLANFELVAKALFPPLSRHLLPLCILGVHLLVFHPQLSSLHWWTQQHDHVLRVNLIVAVFMASRVHVLQQTKGSKLLASGDLLGCLNHVASGPFQPGS